MENNLEKFLKLGITNGESCKCNTAKNEVKVDVTKYPDEADFLMTVNLCKKCIRKVNIYKPEIRVG